MPKYNKASIAAAFSTVARLVNSGKPVVLGKVTDLTTNGQVYFRKAVTHNFNEKERGFDLQRIFIIDEKNPQNWHRNTSPNKNPKDESLIDLIILAMSWVAKHYEPKHREKKVQVIEPVKPLTAYSIEELEAEIASRKREMALNEFAKRFGVSKEELIKIAEQIIELI